MDNNKKKTKPPVNVAARMLPHNNEAEQSVLGCVLIDKDAALFILGELKQDDFYSETNGIIFEAMVKIFGQSIPVDFITLTDELERQNLMDAVGGMTAVSLLTTIVPSSASYKHYVEIVKKHSMLRKLISASQRIIEGAFDQSRLDEENQAADILAFAEKQIFDIGEGNNRSSLQGINQSLDEVIERLDLIHRDKLALRGIPTGFTLLDHITNGLQRSDLVLIAARPSQGKTALGMNIVTNIALCHDKKTEIGKNYQYKCAVFSLEMSARQLAQRMLCSAAAVSMSKSMSGKLDKNDWKEVWTAKKSLGDSRIFIDDSSLITPVEILSKCRRLKREHGLDVILIDYLQLMYSGSNKKNENRTNEIADITRRLKIAAKELDVPILLLSQMSRDVEKRTTHKPQLSDLRESGAIEQDADIVMFINRKYDKDDLSVPEELRNEVDLIISKHRNGETGTVPLYWHGETVTFRNLIKQGN